MANQHHEPLTEETDSATILEEGPSPAPASADIAPLSTSIASAKRPVKKNLRMLSFGEEEEQLEDALSLKRPKASAKETASRAARAAAPPPAPSPLQTEIEQLKLQLLKTKATTLAAEHQASSSTSPDHGTKTAMSPSEPATSTSVEALRQAYAMKRPSTLTGKRKLIPENEELTLRALDRFAKRLQGDKLTSSAHVSATAASSSSSTDDSLRCSLHGVFQCESCGSKLDRPSTSPSPLHSTNWLHHELHFVPDASTKTRIDDPNDLIVIDPREKAREISSTSHKRR